MTIGQHKSSIAAIRTRTVENVAHGLHGHVEEDSTRS